MGQKDVLQAVEQREAQQIAFVLLRMNGLDESSRYDENRGHPCQGSKCPK